MGDRPVVAAFRPPDDRAERARSTLERLGAEALLDPMVVPRPTGALPRTDADVVVLTSPTAAELLSATGWSPGDATVAAIGPRTAESLRGIDLGIDIVPETYSSSGLVDALASDVEGRTVEIARSDHGSSTLVEGLWEAGAYVHETVLYELIRPATAGQSIDAILSGELDAVAFTSSLTVEHFLGLAEDRDALLDALDAVVVGAIGDPTAETARARGIAVDVVPERATFEALAVAVIERLDAATSRSA